MFDPSKVRHQLQQARLLPVAGLAAQRSLCSHAVIQSGPGAGQPDILIAAFLTGGDARQFVALMEKAGFATIGAFRVAEIAPDGSTTDRDARLTAEMAIAMNEIRRDRGAVTDRDLINCGFTPAELAALAPAAIDQAAAEWHGRNMMGVAA